MKKAIVVLLIAALVAVAMTGCGAENNANAGKTNDASTADPVVTGNFDTNKAISVVSREDGSGTRGAFIELLGIEQKGDDGSRKDLTTKEAVIARQTDVMMTNIAGNVYGIGYISMGSLNDTVKAISVEGAAATTENVKNGTFPIARPFNIATAGAPEGLAKDFIDFILSAEGQVVVETSYISVDSAAPAYAGTKPAGKIVVAGSSSVTPIMEKLKEAYVKINPDAQIEVQLSDSSAGMNSAINGTCDIGMASRALKDSELELLTPVQIAIDGIAVIVNNDNPIDNLTQEQIKGIYIGEILNWSEVAE